MNFTLSEPMESKLSRFRAALRHAFAVQEARNELPEEDRVLLERVAEAIVIRGMAAPATVFLESMGPMNFLGSQALHFVSPIIECALNAKEVDQVARLLERRDTISRLIVLIDAKSAAPQGTPAQ
ncbi:MAG: hypothetical protein AB7G68_04945 [Nitrospiraceae bacterium]